MQQPLTRQRGRRKRIGVMKLSCTEVVVFGLLSICLLVSAMLGFLVVDYETHWNPHSPASRTGFFRGLLPIRDPSATTCIVVGMFSRSNEFDLRQWHRDKFKRDVELHGNAKRNIKIQLRFSVAYNADDKTVMQQVYEEQDKNGDLFLLHVREKYSWLVANLFDMLRQSVHLLDDYTCSSKFIIKADTDVMVSFDALVPIVMSVPDSSTYFGLMQPHTVTHDLQTRIDSDISHSYMPVWAVGQLYGMSSDVAEVLITPEVERTVLKRDIGYMYPEEDRSIGLALARSQITVKHIIFVKGLYFFCPPESFSCDDYGDSVAFGVGLGMSGEGDEKAKNKLNMLQKIRVERESCRALDANVESRYSYMDEIENDSRDWFFHGCKSLSKEGTLMKKAFQQRHAVATVDLLEHQEKEEECAEAMYRRSYPEVAKQIERGVYKSGKEHYIKWGYQSARMHYFCPHTCLDATVLDNCLQCDEEAMYLKNYPDIQEPVKAGIFKSGRDHYEKHGKAEGRSYSCYTRFQEEGHGNLKECEETFSDFMSATASIVHTWPVAGKGTKLNPKSGKAVLFIEGRLHFSMAYALRVHRRYTGPDWMFYILSPPDVADVWREKFAGPMVTIVDIPHEFGDLSQYPEQINALYRSKFLWETVIQCEYVLVTQTDALLLRHGVEDFFQYSYVGSPIDPQSFPTTDWRYLCARDKKCGGNGGLSLRRRSECLRALDSCSIPQELFDEDVWYSACLMEEKGNRTISMPHPKIANRFSTGSACQFDNPVGVHKLWQNCKRSTCAVTILNSQLYTDIFGDENSKDFCEEGELYYMAKYYMDVERKGYVSGWDHYKKYGIHDKRTWRCLDLKSEPIKAGPSPYDLPKSVTNSKHNKFQQGGWLVW